MLAVLVVLAVFGRAVLVDVEVEVAVAGAV